MIKKIHIGAIIIVIVFFAVVLIISPSGKDIVNAEIEANLQEEYVGIVTANYYDRKEHNFKTTIISTSRGNKVIHHIRDTSGLFEYLIVGDSIFKHKGSMEVMVKRNNSIKIFEIDIPRKE